MEIALIQMSSSPTVEDNLQKALTFIERAAAAGAELVLLPELFAAPYFCQTQREEHFASAHPLDSHPFLSRFGELARSHRLWLPVSFFERAGPCYYNSLAWFNPEGQQVALYRKSHIPDGPGYQEKYYFRPGATGPVTVETPEGRVGAGICWDQWYPELARSLVLEGAELILYPTTIGSEPPEAGSLDTRAMWQKAMLGHAVCNACYVAAANRVGPEGEARYYGSSFICDYTGTILAEADCQEEALLRARLDFSAARTFRAAMGFFRDRRPELYQK